MSTKSVNSTSQTLQENTQSHKLRLWPLFLLLALIPLCFLPEYFFPGELPVMMIRFMGPGLLSILILVWWLGFSNEKFVHRLWITTLTLASAVAIVNFLDPSMFWEPFVVLTLPMGVVLFSLATIGLRNSNPTLRGLMIAIAATIGFSFSLFLRNDGLWGGQGVFDFQWRSGLASDQKLSTDSENSLYSNAQKTNWLSSPQWPGFRGVNRNGLAENCQIQTDWIANPPKVAWERDAGLSWSSFAVAGNMLFTQEQRGGSECTICYDTFTGKEIWIHSNPSRFEDHLGGPGPRATPTIANSDIFCLGAHGHLFRLEGTTGKIKWATDLREMANRKPPHWGFCSSPLVINGLVIVHAGGDENKGVLAFDIETGALKWASPSGDHSYSSPQLITLHEKQVIAMSSNRGLDLIDPGTGKNLLHYQWKAEGYRTPQPALFRGDSIILAGETGTRILQIGKTDQGELEVLKTTKARRFRPDFNDFVVQGDYAYGFSGANFRSLHLPSGKTSRTRENYGKGQVLGIEGSEHLLVISETGDLILLETSGGEFEEVDRIDQAIQGKTWNHPVLIKDRLYLRNSKQAKCFQLPTSR